MTSIKIKDVVQAYDKPGGGKAVVLDGISLELTGPSVNMLLGPSGCGKSTLLHMLGGVRPFEVRTPTSGAVHIDGHVCDDASDDAIMVFQQYANRPDLTVRQNCTFPFGLKLHRNIPKSDWMERVDSMLKAVGLGDKPNHYSSQLSGGQNQRLALARALALRPKILLMDEPFGALDAQTRRDMQQLLLTLQESFQCLIVFVTHDITEALLLGDRILVLSPSPAKVVGDYALGNHKRERPHWIRSDEGKQLGETIIAQLSTVKGAGQVRVSI